MNREALLDQIVKNASPQNPHERQERVANQMIRTAFSEESTAFVTWVLAENKKWTVADVQRCLDKIGVPMSENTEQKRGPLEKGEIVRPDKLKNKNPMNVEECEQYHEQFGTVTDVESGFVIVEFMGHNTKVRFEGNTSGQDTGIYRQSSAQEGRPSRAMVEIVYIKDPASAPPPKSRVEQLREYVEKGLAAGESRFDVYYSGEPIKQAEGKNGYYFSVTTQQRAAFPTSFNPLKGSVLYIGVMGKRPGGWKQDLADRMKKEEGGEAA